METAVVEPTTAPAPETSSPAPSSAPATSATPTTVSPPPVVERLKDAKDVSAFLRKAADAPLVAATPDTPPVAQPEAATTAQAQEPVKAGEVPSATPGPIPFPQHKQILENARREFDTYKQRHGWAETIPQAKLQEWGTFADRVKTDLPGVIAELTQAGMNHPIWGPQLRSSAGRTLASAPAARPEPDVQVVNAQGQVVSMTFSAETLAEVQAWDRAQMTGEFKQLIQPFQEERDTRLRDAAIAEEKRQNDAIVLRGLAQVNGILKGKHALGPKVAEYMAQGMDPIDAALKVRDEFIEPTVTEAAQAAVLETQKKKAAGNTANGSGAAALPKRLMTEKDVADFLRAGDGA